MNHLVIAPILLPLLCGALSLLFVRRLEALARVLNLAGCILLLPITLWMLLDAGTDHYRVYALGGWPAPFGIVLVADRLSALMLALTSLVALCSLLYALAGELRANPYFHILFQFQILGLNGAFLTGDLFNLFVFFEILLIASYGLLLQGEGAGAARTRATLHYVVLNLAGSALFLIAVGVIYGVTGTLNMADLARQAAQPNPANASLLQAGALLLLVVFMLKAALLPLYFWLPAAYSTAAAPVAALFAIMTKVGVYSILRIFTLIFGAGAGAAAGVAEPWLLPMALLTVALGAIGVLAATSLRLLVSYLVIVSVGTLLAGVGLFTAAGISAALYYLLHTTMITVCLYLLADVIARQRGSNADTLTAGTAVGRPVLTGAMFFLAAIAVAGMPPLSGFLGKLLILEAAVDHRSMPWLWGALLGGGLLGIIALGRAGSVLFWTSAGRPVLTLPALPLAAAMLPLAASPLLVLFAHPVQEYTTAATAQLLLPQGYIDAVLDRPAPSLMEHASPEGMP
ncbi:MAG: monovalent cation/H+ antiporter subunit D [Gammaproteobacteria bacterium]|nr:monovalent cation/H+ antiporter subunit D [Gammaproteobacteria bacterium]